MCYHNKRDWTAVLCAFAVAVTALLFGSPTAHAATIRGRVVDAQTQAAIYRATVVLQGSAYSTQTDRDGRFVLDNIAIGEHSLRVDRLGYEALTQVVTLAATSDVSEIEIGMTSTGVPLEEVMVTPGAFHFMDTGSNTEQTMSREDIESAPQLAEDLFRAVNRLPGLASGDYSAHFGVRGGRHDETLILFDDLELYEPYHLKDFNEGALSIIDTETVEGVQLMTGGFPARYGNKRSGVFNITSRQVEMDRNHYSLGLSLMNARAMGRGPLWGGKGSWLVSGRSGYMDLVFRMISQDELPSPRYHDIYAKTQVELSPDHSLSLNLLYAGDSYKFDAASTTGFADSIQTREFANNSYLNTYLWTSLRSTFGDRIHARTLLSGSLVTQNRDGNETPLNGTPIYAIENTNDLKNAQFWTDWNFGLTNSLALNVGADVRYLDNKDSYQSIVYSDPDDPADPGTFYPVTTNTQAKNHGRRVGLYASTRLRFYQPLVFEIGGRYDHASYTHDDDLSPRIGAALDIGGGRTLRAGWGHYRQIQDIDDVDTLNNGRYFRSELTEMWSGGIEQIFGRGSVLRVEGYYKEGSELRPAFRNWKGGIDTFPETNEDRIEVFPVSNTIRGLEIYFDHNFNDRMATRASYALSDGEETVTNMVNVNSDEPLQFDPTHALPIDQRHAFNADFSYRFRRLWMATAAFAFHSGWPGTSESLVTRQDDNGNDVQVLRPDKIYGIRLPNYLRLDVRATRRWLTSRGEMRFFVEVVNLTNHANVFGYDNIRTSDGNGNIIQETEPETWFTILPSLGVAWVSHF